MTKEEMFDWLERNHASVIRSAPMRWTRSDGSEFVSDFSLTAGGIQFEATETLAEAIVKASEYLK